MKQRIVIIASDAEGRVANLSVETDAEWIALDMSDVPAMAKFHPFSFTSVLVDQESGHQLRWDDTVLGSQPSGELDDGDDPFAEYPLEEF